MVCKHECKLGKVLTAATPRFQQRFDADLKEDRILQAQHGGSQKVRLHQKALILHGSRHFHVTKPKRSTLHQKKRTPLTFVAPLHYPPQVLVKGIILNDSMSSC